MKQNYTEENEQKNTTNGVVEEMQKTTRKPKIIKSLMGTEKLRSEDKAIKSLIVVDDAKMSESNNVPDTNVSFYKSNKSHSSSRLNHGREILEDLLNSEWNVLSDDINLDILPLEQDIRIKTKDETKKFVLRFLQVHCI